MISDSKRAFNDFKSSLRETVRTFINLLFLKCSKK